VCVYVCVCLYIYAYIYIFIYICYAAALQERGRSSNLEEDWELLELSVTAASKFVSDFKATALQIRV
jgi:hypothetical protein